MNITRWMVRSDEGGQRIVRWYIRVNTFRSMRSDACPAWKRMSRWSDGSDHEFTCVQNYFKWPLKNPSTGLVKNGMISWWALWNDETNRWCRLFTRLLLKVMARIKVVLLPESIVVALDCLLHFALLSFHNLAVYLCEKMDRVISSS